MSSLSDDNDSKLPTPEFTPRRLTRNRTRPKKYDQFFDSSPTKRTRKYVESSDEEFNDESTPKPKALFTSDDVEGQDIFKFKSRHTKLDLQNKVKTVVGNIVDSPMKTPKKNMHLLQKINDGNTQTPKHIVNIMKKKIIAEVESSESDFSGSSSDFVPEKSDESGSSSESNSGSEDDEAPQKISAGTNNRNKNRTKPKDSEYFVAPDNYFIMNSTKKITTSDHTMARLKNLNINENEQDEEIYVSAEHRSRISDLVQTYDALFNKWLYILSEGFNIILYGVGSKRVILERFRERIKHAPCVVVDGSFPGLTVRSVLESVLVELLGLPLAPAGLGEALGLLRARLGPAPLFLLLNNLDGAELRSVRAQAALAALAALRNVHLVATVDHINAPLLWDHGRLSKYQFSFFDATTFLPYEREVSDPARTHHGLGPRLAALRGVYRSLTHNARAVFDLLVDHHLQHHKQPHYQGLPFQQLYSLCRERFLCSAVPALRALLAEFIDHRLLRRRAAGDLLQPSDHEHVLRQHRALQQHD